MHFSCLQKMLIGILFHFPSVKYFTKHMAQIPKRWSKNHIYHFKYIILLQKTFRAQKFRLDTFASVTRRYNPSLYFCAIEKKIFVYAESLCKFFKSDFNYKFKQQMNFVGFKYSSFVIYQEAESSRTENTTF